MRSKTVSISSAGFTLVEVLVALAITVIVLSAVFGLLFRGQGTFRREPEVADLQQSARVGLDMINRDLTMAGFKTPPAAAVMWSDGGGLTPDEMTTIFSDPEIPTAEPLKCGGAGQGSGQGPCGTIDSSSTLNLDPASLDPAPPILNEAYAEGMVLFAIEKEDCNGDGQVGIYPFELTQPPRITNAGGKETLQLNHNPGKAATDLNLPGGFNGQVHPDCAIVGRFRVVQYRVNPLPPAPNPNLERRDISLNEPWIPVARNIENLQFQYAAAIGNWTDVPPPPSSDDPKTWIHRVKVTITGRSESRNLEGATEGPFSADDTHLRRTFSTSVSLRNVLMQAANQSSATEYN